MFFFVASIGKIEGIPFLALLPYRLLALAISASILAMYAYLRYLRPLRPQRVAFVPELPSNQAMRIQQAASLTTHVTLAQAKAFAHSIVAPTQLRQRITERYEPSSRTLRHTVTMDVRLPNHLQIGFSMADGQSGGGTQKDSAVVLFPALLPAKGELMDNLRFFSADAEPLPDLAYREYLQLVAAVLRVLLLSAYATKEPDLWKVSPEAVHAERAALDEIIRRNNKPIAYDKSAAKDIANLKAVNKNNLKLAAQLVQLLSSRYAIVVPVPLKADGRFTVGYERTIIPQLDLLGETAGFLGWLKSRARVLFGARPVSLTLPLDNAWTAQSFHMLVHSEEGLYLGSQESPELEPYIRWHDENPRPGTMAPPYYRFRKRLGQSYAHFYTRFFPEPHPDQDPTRYPVPRVRVKFYEAPPGSVFRAAVAAVSAAALIWLVGFVAVRLEFQNSNNLLNTDAPAILLAFPAVIAGWLGFEKPTRRLLEGTLIARFSLLATAAMSIMASGLFMIYQANIHLLHQKTGYGVSILGIHDGAWCVLIMAALINAIGVSFACMMRTWEFLLLSSRANPDGGAISE